MTMTYAAQVRSMSKSLPKQALQEDFYDINSLRIICQYFVGSVVVIKTVDEVIEGILHTISNNTICLTLVTTTKFENPDKLLKMSSSKLITLNDVLSIATKDSGELDVTMKGKYIKSDKENTNTNNSSIVTENIKKISSKPQNNKGPKNPIQVNENLSSLIVATELEVTDIVDHNLQTHEERKDNVTVTPKNDVCEPKKMFSFNPNAPEFKPRPFVSFSNNVTPEPILFSPPAQPFPHVFTPASAPAIFVPNLYFYAPNHVNTIETPSNDIFQSPLNNNHLTDFHGPNNVAHSFAPIVPIFQHPLPIFIPNQPYRMRKGHHEVTSESSNTTDVSAATVDTVDNELSNPCHWPPLPNTVTALVAPSTVNNNDASSPSSPSLNKTDEKP